jgi:hypothetical protein
VERADDEACTRFGVRRTGIGSERAPNGATERQDAATTKACGTAHQRAIYPAIGDT